MAWLQHLYELSRAKSAEAGVTVPSFDEFWQAGIAEAKGENRDAGDAGATSAPIPAAHPLKTPSGKIEIFSEKIASFGYDDCPGHAAWLEPIEWLGSQDGRALSAAHAVGPADRQAAQPARPQPAFAAPPRSRAASRSPCIPTMPPARGIADGDLVRVFNDRGACLAAARLSDRIRRGVVRLSTGAWFDPADSGSNRPLEKHGNPNALTLDIGASKLSQGCIAPDLPGRDRALRRAGARRDRASPARVREALTRFAGPCYGRVVTAGQPRRTCRRQRRSRAHRHGRSCRPSRGSAFLPPPPSAMSPGSVWRRR